jgi:hypothetical protein
LFSSPSSLRSSLSDMQLRNRWNRSETPSHEPHRSIKALAQSIISARWQALLSGTSGPKTHTQKAKLQLIALSLFCEKVCRLSI